MKIKAAEKGPLSIEVTEAKILRGGNEEILSYKVIALCRRDQSSNKSFFDGAHKSSGFF